MRALIHFAQYAHNIVRGKYMDSLAHNETGSFISIYASVSLAAY